MLDYDIIDRDTAGDLWEPALGCMVWNVRMELPPRGLMFEIGDPEIWVFYPPEMSMRRKYFAPGNEHFRGTRGVAVIGRYSFVSAYAHWELKREGEVIGNVNGGDREDKICRDVLDGQILEGISVCDTEALSLVFTFDLNTVLVVGPMKDQRGSQDTAPPRDSDEWELSRSDGVTVRKRVDGLYIAWKEER